MAKSGVSRRGLLRTTAICAAGLAGLGRAAAQPPRPRRKPLPPAPPHVPTVAIDPGHGGVDPGAVGAGGIYEKDIALATARDLAQALADTHRFRTFLTRTGDEFVPLKERVERARAQHADLFLSIHADALPDGRKRGLSVYTLSAEASDRDAALLAASENRDVVEGINLSRQPRQVGNILLDLARRQTGNLSARLAGDVVAALGSLVVLLERPQRSADFAVLTAPDIPSALVELGCLSNPTEERLLQQPAYRRRLARGLALAIEAYFEELDPG